MQYTCEMTSEQQSTKFRQLCVVTFFGSLTACLFAIFVRWIYLQGKIHQIEWDMATITAGDYTVEMPIKKENYLDWLNKNNRDSDVPPSLKFKHYLIQVIETEMTKDLKVAMEQGF